MADNQPLAREVRASALPPRLGGDSVNFARPVRMGWEGDPNPAHSPMSRPGGTTADNRIYGRAGTADAGRVRTYETAEAGKKAPGAPK